MVFLGGSGGGGVDYSLLLTVLNYNLDSKINSFLYNNIKNCNINLRHLPCLRNRIFCLIIEKINYLCENAYSPQERIIGYKAYKHLICHNLVSTYIYLFLKLWPYFFSFFFKLEDFFFFPQSLVYRFDLTRQMFAYFRFIILRK